MTAELDHTIIPARDREASARFLADILGLAVGPEAGPFLPVELANGVTLDYMHQPGEIAGGHYAFALDDAGFDAAHARIRAAGITYYADPLHSRAGEIYRDGAKRGLYFRDPSGHNMEILTRG